MKYNILDQNEFRLKRNGIPLKVIENMTTKEVRELTKQYKKLIKGGEI